jgi:membrane fusion protein, multidrug efflux system
MLRLCKGFILVSAVCCLVFLCGCEKPHKPVMREPAVTAGYPVEKEVTRYLEYAGTLQATQMVELRARVAGFLEKIHFEPDARVKTGDLLFTIDPSQYQAAVNLNQAEVEANKAKFRLAKTEEMMFQQLQTQQAASALRLDEKIANSNVAKAGIDVAQAELDKSNLNLEWSRIVSPVNGRISRWMVDVGNLVGAMDKTVLATIVNDDIMWCYFSLSELDLLDLKETHKNSSDQRLETLKIPAFLTLANGKPYSHEGRIDYADVKLNPSTGTIQARAVFPNPEGLLLAGMYGRVRVPIENRKAMLVPGTAIQFDQSGNYVLVVNDKNIVEYRQVKIGQKIEEMTVIEEGVSPQDRVITLGVQRARPGSKVKLTEAPPATLPKTSR